MTRETEPRRRGRLVRRWGASLLSSALFLALTPGPAAADDATCSYSPSSRTITVTVMPGENFAPSLLPDGSGNLLISDADGTGGSCGGTVDNTDTVVINNSSTTQPLVFPFYLGLREPLGPGFSNESGSSDEIEFVVDFGPGGKLGLQSAYSTTDPGTGPVYVTIGADQINLNAGEQDGIDADVTLTGVTEVQVYTGAFDDRIIGSGGSGTPATPTSIPIFASPGFDGSDTIIGGDGADRLFGQEGADYIDGAAGDDVVQGGGGNYPDLDLGDILFGGLGKDTMDGHAGDDTIDAGAGNDFVGGGLGNDFIDARAGKDRVGGGEGDDRLKGRGGRDNLRGELGNDFLNAGAGKDKAKGNVGKDVLRGRGGPDLLAGGPGNDRHFGGAGDDHCPGGPGSDTFHSCEHHD